jgi:NAD(P)-dependent dehydrogenase (short-subunit alcohol dehydrogenase family)
MLTINLEHKTAIVTGAAGGIGLAVAESLAAAGANLMLADIQPNESGQAELLGLGRSRASTMLCDISDEAAIDSLAQQTLSEFGSIDIIVNVAGVIAYRSIADLTREDWLRSLGVNLIGAALLTAQGFRHMKPGGAIVNISSVHAEGTAARVAPYAAAKSALVSLTRSAAIEGQALGIRANAILPGAIDTPMLRASENLATGAEAFDPSEVGLPADIGPAAAYLASDLSRFVTGTTLVIDGGLLSRL